MSTPTGSLSVRIAIATFSFLTVSQLARVLPGIGDAAEYYLKAVIILILLGACGWHAIAVRRMLIKPIPAVVILFSSACLASLVWSVSTVETSKALGGLAACLCVGFLIRNEALSSRCAYRAVGYGCVALVVTSVVTGVFGVANVFDYKDGVLRLAGVSYGAHALARAAVISAAIFTFTGRNSPSHWRAVLYLGGALGICSVTSSRQGVILVVLAAAFYLHGTLSRHHFSALLAAGALSLLAMSLYLDLLPNLVALVARNGADDVFTLTNRTRIWELVLWTIKSNPFVGIGYGAGGIYLLENFYMDSGWTTTTTHNMALQIFLEQGALGIVAYSALLFSGLWAAIRSRESFPRYLLAAVLALGFVENSVASAPEYLFLLLIALICSTRKVSHEISDCHV